MTVIASTLLDAANQPSGGRVEIELVGPGFVNGGQVLAKRIIDVPSTGDNAGVWSRDLIPNDTYEVAGTYYLVTQVADDASRDVRAITVPSVGGPYSLYSRLVDVLGDLEPAEVASVRGALALHEENTDLHAGNPLQVVHDGTPEVGDWLKVKSVEPLVVERADEPGGGSGHTTHAIADVTDLQATLDAKETPAGAQAKANAAAAAAAAAAAGYTDAEIAGLSGTYVPLAIIDASGDLIVGSAADAAARLAKGTALQVLRVNAAGTALEWADPAGSGGDHDDGDHTTFQPLDSDLTAIAALTTTAFGRGLLEMANAGAVRTALGLGTAALAATGDFDAAGAAAAAQAASQPLDSDLTALAALTTTAYGRSLLEAANAGAARTLLGLGTAALSATGDFDPAGSAAAAQAASQPLDSDLTAIAAVTTTAYGRAFLALADAAAGRTALGLGTAATSNTGDFQAADADLTAIAALTTTAFGRSLLETANAAAARTLLDAAQFSHAHAEPEVIGIACSDETTAITTGNGKATFRMPFAMTLTAVRATLTTASSSGLVTVDINEGGSTILSTKLTVDQSEKTSTTAATAAVISDSALTDDAEITVDIDGAGTGATGLKVWLVGTRT